MTKSVLQIVPIQPNAMVDLTAQEGINGVNCPAPLVEAIRVFRDLRPGEVLLIVSSCSGTKDDLFAWVEQTGNEVVKIDTRLSGKTEYYVRKGKQAHRAVHVVLDMRGAACPGPVVEARKILQGMQAGEILKLVSSCTAARVEVGTWVTNSRNELLETRDVENGSREFYIRKG